MAKVRYEVVAEKPGAHLFRIRLWIAEPNPDGQRLSLPAWIPGSYMIRDFAKNIVEIRARRGGEVPLRKIDKQTWLCEQGEGPLQVEYQVYAWDLSVRSAHLDTSHGYFNGTSLFLRVHGFEGEDHWVDLLRPEGSAFEAWTLATSMQKDAVDGAGFGRYRASDYDDLIDHPVEMGELTRLSFEVVGKLHEMAIYGRHNADLSRIRRDLTKICAEHVALFGEFPDESYLFLVMAVGDGYGGLEHRRSTSLLCSRSDFPTPGDKKVSKDYRNFLGLCSHEYFHLWNVKRIRPAAFMKAGLEAEVHTELLWVFEGFTSYFDDLALVRSGCISVEDYLDQVAKTVTRVLQGSGRRKQSVAESSFDTWTKFYKQDENAPNAIVSYYAKGALAALALDLTLRTESPNPCSMDDVMRALWSRFGKPDIGVGERDVEALVRELSGMDLSGFFDAYIHGTEDLPLDDLLCRFGVELQLRPAEDQKDQGGSVKEFTASKERLELGLRLSGSADPTVAVVYDDGAAQQAGISAGDVLVALNGLKITPSNLEALIGRLSPDELCVIHLFRRDELMEFQLTLQPAPYSVCELRLGKEPSAFRDDWLAPCGRNG